MPPSDGSALARLARDSIVDLGIGAAWTRRLRIDLHRFVSLVMEPGTELRAQVDDAGLEVSASPPATIVARRFSPDVRLERAAFDFGRGRFSLSSRSTPPILRRAVDPLLSRALDRRVRPLFPATLRVAGYSPRRDPDLRRTVAALGAVLGSFAGVRGPFSPVSDELATALDGARDLHGWSKLVAADTFVLPLRSPELERVIPVGTRISLQLATRGKVASARLERLAVRAHDRGAWLRWRGPDGGDVDVMELKSVTAAARGQVHVEGVMRIDPLAEGDLLERIAAIVMPSRDPGSPLQVDEVRQALVRLITARVRTVLDEGLRRLEVDLPGSSLRDFLGGDVESTVAPLAEIP